MGENPREIAYSDGSSNEALILHLLKAEKELASWKTPARANYSSWPVRYHLCPERANLLRHLDFSGLDVLELGAGMGGVSRFLAEKAAHLTVIEGTKARFSALSERLRDRKNWQGIVGNFQDVTPDQFGGKKFDVVCVIGVLEYAELFIQGEKGESAQRAFLKKAVSWLKEEGVLLLAIENRLGLKYWSGAAEDHTGQLFDGICFYPDAPSPRTFSRQELLRLLGEAGLGSQEEFFPFPDYKVPVAVLSRRFIDEKPRLAAELAASRSYENYGLPRVSFFPDFLAVRGVAEAGLLPELANSFLFLASRKSSGAVWKRLLGRPESAWYYSNYRQIPTQTLFRLSGSEALVRKVPLCEEDPDEASFAWKDSRVTWKALPEVVAGEGESLRRLLAREAYFGRWNEFQKLFDSFLAWSFETWKAPQGRLDGGAIDATWTNACVFPASSESPGGYSLFDLEWESENSISKQWFLLRNAYLLALDTEISWRGAPFRTLADWYRERCHKFSLKPEWEATLSQESRFQAAVTTDSRQKHHRAALVALLEAPLVARFPRAPAEESGLREEARRFRQLMKKLPVRGVRWAYRRARSLAPGFPPLFRPRRA